MCTRAVGGDKWEEVWAKATRLREVSVYISRILRIGPQIVKNLIILDAYGL